MNYDPSYKTAHLYQYGDPVPLHALTPATGAVMQDFVLSTNNRYFITQAATGESYESTVITRFNPVTGNSDSMKLIDAGHGIGIEVEYSSAGTFILLTWRGKTADSGWRENDYVYFPYVAGGTYRRGTMNNEFGLKVQPLNEPEMLVHNDWKTMFCVCKHYDSAGNDVYTRRNIVDLRNGVDKKYGQITLPISTGTLQGFATINDTLYRYMGKGAVNGVMDSSDPIAIEEFDWNTGAQIAYKTYPNLGKVGGAWRDGKCEPEGMGVYTEANGRTSLLVGVTTGNTGNHRWQTFKFGDIGQ